MSTLILRITLKIITLGEMSIVVEAGFVNCFRQQPPGGLLQKTSGGGRNSTFSRANDEMSPDADPEERLKNRKMT